MINFSFFKYIKMYFIEYYKKRCLNLKFGFLLEGVLRIIERFFVNIFIDVLKVLSILW